jgi:Carboxypeptidase regulatory-like domain
MRLQFWLAVAGVCLIAAPARAQTESTLLTGTVVDARTGAPLERVLAVIEPAGGRQPSGKDESRPEAFTDAQGRFELRGLAPGAYRVTVSVVGYALYRQEVTLGRDPVTVNVRLSEGTTAYSETVIVTPDPFRAPPDPVPSASVLGSAELLNLRGVLADDPLRAVQVLPGVATGDDLRSEFTMRGSDFKHLTFTVDGFATPYLLHTVRGVEDRGSTGSVAMINSDVLEDVTLLNGSYAQRFGGHTGAEVDFRTREGSRARPIVRAAVSGTAASGVAEGPIGRNRRGSWLVSGRQSYIDHLVQNLTERSVSFGFADAQGRLAYDLTPSQHVDLTVLAGHSRFLNEPDDHDVDYLYDGRNASVVGVAGWRLARPRLLLAQHVLAAANHFRNINEDGLELDDGRDVQLAWRADATIKAAAALQIDAGGAVEHREDSRVRRRRTGDTLTALDNYSADAIAGGGYATIAWTPWTTLTITPGVRADRWTLADQSEVSPWGQIEWRLRPHLVIRGGGGRYVQFSDFDKVLGVSGGLSLRPERARQFDAGVEWRVSPTLRATATVYDREEEGMLRRPLSETRLLNGRILIGLRDTRYQNRLDGFARGVELLLQRNVTGRGVSGWLSYAYGRNRYHDVLNGETFWGDYDQRHTLNAYALYRHSDRTSFVAKLRMGSNFPIPGYYAAVPDTDRYTVSEQRNTARLPVYSRFDLRANRAFTWSKRRLTLFAEVINVLNRANYRFDPPRVIGPGLVSSPLDSLLPVVPSVGFLIEF